MNLSSSVAEAAAALRRGGLAAFPTDTYFALGADALNEQAVRSVFAAKGRDDGRPVPVLLADASDVAAVAAEFPAAARRLAERYWPGPLTLVLPRRAGVPDVLARGAATIGVRVPDHDVARQIIRELGRPVTGTSANVSGQPPMKKAEEVRRALGGRVDYLVDAPCGEHSAPSTVIDFTGTAPVIVRVGAIPPHEIAGLIRGVAVRTGD